MRYVPARGAAAVAAALFLAAPATSLAQAQESRRSPIVIAVEKTRPSVVGIKVTKARTGRQEVTGTGVVVDERGFIVTNRHVVGGNQNLTVRLSDGTEVAGRVVVREVDFDLAVVKVDTGKKLPALTLGPVNDLMVGETVIAIGHPYGYTFSVSRGIVSALGREITMPTGEVLTDLIQTDASINPGNSGGPLVNVNGELIGINVAMRDGAQGIAFAINAGTVKRVLSRHLSALRVAGVEHGLACGEKVLGETGDRQRVVVAGVSAGAAAEAGVRKGDEILSVGVRPVANGFDVERALWESRPGERVKLKVLREGTELMVTLTLAEAQGGPQAALRLDRPSAQSAEARPGVAVAGRR